MLQAFRSATLLKKYPAQVLSCEYCEILKNTYFEEHLRMAASVIRHEFYIAENIAQKEIMVIKDPHLEILNAYHTVQLKLFN